MVLHLNKKVDREYDSSWGYKRSILGFDQFKQVEIVEIIMERGQRTRKHYHSRVTEMFYVISGTITIGIDDDSMTLTKGDFLVVPPNRKHQITADEDGTAIIAVKTPGDEKDRIFLGE